jgi:aminoglycoside 3-N-acetyltransferase
MPTFTYSFCRGAIYDPDQSPSTVGVLTEYFRRQPHTTRTLHPIFSAAIKGKHQANLQSVDQDAFGKDSIFGKLHAMKGRLVFLGTSMHACTYIHYVEQSHGIPYRFMKTFPGIIREKGQEYPAEATYFVRYLDRNVNLDLQRFESYLLQKGLMQEVRLGHGRILSAEADVIFREGCQLLDKDIYFFLKDKPIEGAV